MNKHILIDKANRYAVNEETTPTGYIFCEEKGYWIDNLTNIPLMSSDDPIKPQTKKCDIETGEDQKGE